MLAFQYRGKLQRRDLGELLAQRRAQVRHLRVIDHVALIEPAHHLARTIRLLVEILEKLDETGRRKPEQAELAWVSARQR